jgi:hypothetical protein
MGGGYAYVGIYGKVLLALIIPAIWIGFFAYCEACFRNSKSETMKQGYAFPPGSR